MAFKMKNPSVAKMAKAAGSNRVAMKMKAESAMKHKTGEIHGHSSGETHDKDGMKMITGADGVTRTQRQHAFAKDEIAARVARLEAAKKDKAAEKDSDSPAKLRKPTRKKDGPKAIDKARKKVGDTAKRKGSAMKKNRYDRLVDKGTKLVDKGMDAFNVEGNEKKSDRKFKRAQKKFDKAKSIKERAEKRANRSNARKLKRAEKKNEFKSPAKLKKASPKKHLAQNPGFGTLKELREHNKDVIAPKGDARRDAKNWTHKKKGKQ